MRDSINKANDLIDYAIELGHEVIAITEHETISNAVKVETYYNKIKEKHPNFKVILGNEIYLVRNGMTKENFSAEQGDKFFHFILLARDAVGHKQLRELSTRAWLRSWKQGKMTRVPTYYQDLIDIIGNNPGHMVASTACMGGFLASKLSQYRQNKSEEFYEKIKNWIVQMQKLFGKSNFYLEMQPSHNEEQIFVNKELIKLSKELGAKYIITTDSHYMFKDEADIHKAYLNSQDGEREVDSFYATTYMMGDMELRSFFEYLSEEELQEAYQAIIEIKNKCEDYSLKKPLKIPNLKWRIPKASNKDAEKYYDKMSYLKNFIDSEYDSDNIMARLLVDKLEVDETLNNKETYDELNECLKATWISSEVNKARWSAYFINLQNILDVCWRAGSIVGAGRGSGVGFLLLYALDLIQINALREDTKTYSWRFLNPERVSVLDLDTDISGIKRSAVLQELRKEYGEDRVANVVTFGTETSKAAIQTAGRGIGLDNDITLYVSSLVPVDRGKARTLKQCYYGDKEAGFRPVQAFIEQMDLYPELWKVAQRIESLVCRVGEHAGGIVFVDEPFTDSTALMKVPNGDTVTQFDLGDDEKCSLIKIDLLSVEALDKIQVCMELLIEYGYIKPEKTFKETYEKVLGVYNIERTNPKMWDMVNNHEILSLFQMEQQSGIQGIDAIHPRSVKDLATLNSVIRLMAQEQGEETPLEKWVRFRKDISQWYLEMRRYGLTQEEIDWLKNNPNIVDGICESQEGLMSLVQAPELGGNSLAFSDKMRKGLAKFLAFKKEIF